MSRQHKPLKARYIGYTKGTENHGDEALIWIIASLLAPEIDVSCDAGEYEVALLGGGTLINQSEWLIDVYTEALNRARAGVVFGSGVGNPAFWGDHFARWEPLLARCHYVGVRGQASARLLREKARIDADVLGDPYLALRSPLNVHPIPGRIAVNLGTTNNSLWGGDEKAFLESMGKLIATLRAAGNEIIWLSVWTEDTDVIRELRSSIAAESDRLLDARAQTLETLATLGTCELFIGEKLHAIAMSAVAGTPFLALEYQPKVRDFAGSIGMDEWTVSTAVRENDQLLDFVHRIRTNRREIARQMNQDVEEKRIGLHEAASRLKRWASEMAGQSAGIGDAT